MTASPFFSIIIPTWNRAAFLNLAVKSVIDQSFLDWELIIVDDGSTDNTKELVSTFTDPRIHYQRQENRERGAARNTGISVAKGKFITFLDSDDLIFSNHLEHARNCITKISDCRIFCSSYQIDRGKDKLNIIHQASINQDIISGNSLSCRGVFIEISVAQKFKFSEDREMSGLEDWELWLRLAARFPFAVDKEITSSLVQHDNRSVINSTPEALERKFYAFWKALEGDSATAAFISAAKRKFYASCYTYIALHIALTHKNRLSALKWMMKGWMRYPKLTFSRRSAAILKNML